MRVFTGCWVLVLAAGAGWGCGPVTDGGGVVGRPAEFVRPTVAVMKFESLAKFPLGWDLGGGMQDVLVHRLVATGRFHVIERPEIDAILREIRFQQSGVTRAADRAGLGQIKNVQYLVKGVVTDFAHVSTGRGFLGLGGLVGGGGSAEAVMGVTVYVVDVRSGEIVCSERLRQSVRASDVNVEGQYKGVAFGGSVFYRTPLGQATSEVIEAAVVRIVGAVGSRRWSPRVAAVRADGAVVLNGGADREVAVGREYEVLGAGAAVVDPETGDEIGREPGAVVGRVRVVEVQEKLCVGEVVSGKVEVGMGCRVVGGRQ